MAVELISLNSINNKTNLATQSSDGLLSSSDKKKIDELDSNYLPRCGGSITGVIRKRDTIITNEVDTTSVNIAGGTELENGAALILRGKNQSNVEGNFELWAKNETDEHCLVGRPDGTLTWNGCNICVDNSDHLDIGSDDVGGFVVLVANSEGGNIGLTKVTSDGVNPRFEMDTCYMNGTDGSVRLFLGDSTNVIKKCFEFKEQGDFVDANGISMDGLYSSLKDLEARVVALENK